MNPTDVIVKYVNAALAAPAVSEAAAQLCLEAQHGVQLTRTSVYYFLRAFIYQGTFCQVGTSRGRAHPREIWK